jgi:hypothetical protein
MPETFDMSGALRFDLERGRVTVGSDAPGVLLPVDALGAVCRHLDAGGVKDLGHGWGNELGRRVADRLSSDMPRVSTAQMVDHLGGELALAGLGSLSVEFWGHALILAVSDSPLRFGDRPAAGKPDAGDRLLANILEGALIRTTGRAVRIATLARVDSIVRFVACSDAAREKIEALLAEGCHYGEALARLNEGAVAGGGS